MPVHTPLRASVSLREEFESGFLAQRRRGQNASRIRPLIADAGSNTRMLRPDQSSFVNLIAFAVPPNQKSLTPKTIDP